MKVTYNRSLLALISSVLKHYGAQMPDGILPNGTLPELDELLAKDFKNVVVMLFDGMGTAILEKHLPPEAFLRRNLRCTISSVYPSTTTAATLTMETGLSPLEHGWLGWSLYFDEIGANVNVFPNTLSGSGGQPAADYDVAHRYLPYRTVYERITKATDGGVAAYCVSPFSDYRSQSISEICDAVGKLCAQAGRKYIYTYWPQPDTDMHELGTAHEQITTDIRQIGEAVEALCANLSDTLVVVTADHGLVDTQWRFILDYPDIADCLLRPPSVESRAMSLFIKPGMHALFKTVFNEHFGDCYKLLTRQEALKMNLFGGGTPHPRSAGFIGDYLAVAVGDVAIGYTPSTEHGEFKAAHAGMTDDEMSVPFIAVEK